MGESTRAVVVQSGAHRTVVKNCVFRNYEKAYVNGITDWTEPDYITNNTFEGNGEGIEVYFNHHVNILNNTFSANDQGIRLGIHITQQLPATGTLEQFDSL